MTFSFVKAMDNESQNILNQVKEIHDRLKPHCNMEVVVFFDNNSPGYTVSLIEGDAGWIGTRGGRRTLPFR